VSEKAAEVKRDCPACGGPQTVLVVMRPNNHRYQQDAPRILYLCCSKCAQGQIVEK